MSYKQIEASKILPIIQAAIAEERSIDGAVYNLQSIVDTTDPNDLYTLCWEDDETDWENESPANPIARRNRNWQLMDEQGDPLIEWFAEGYFSRYTPCGERFSTFGEYEPETPSDDWEEILKAFGLDADEWSPECPKEPSEPTQDKEGEYFVMGHGWETGWSMREQYGTEEEARAAAAIADRKTTEANSDNAYGWGYAVATKAGKGDTPPARMQGEDWDTDYMPLDMPDCHYVNGGEE